MSPRHLVHEIPLSTRMAQALGRPVEQRFMCRRGASKAPAICPNRPVPREGFVSVHEPVSCEPPHADSVRHQDRPSRSASLSHELAWLEKRACCPASKSCPRAIPFTWPRFPVLRWEFTEATAFIHLDWIAALLHKVLLRRNLYSIITATCMRKLT
jgi:hypothetical protein